MPLSEYYGGRGDRVASDMKERYGKRWKEVFYATANKKGQTPRKPSAPRRYKRVEEKE